MVASAQISVTPPEGQKVKSKKVRTPQKAHFTPNPLLGSAQISK